MSATGDHQTLGDHIDLLLDLFWSVVAQACQVQRLCGFAKTHAMSLRGLFCGQFNCRLIRPRSCLLGRDAGDAFPGPGRVGLHCVVDVAAPADGTTAPVLHLQLLCQDLWVWWRGSIEILGVFRRRRHAAVQCAAAIRAFGFEIWIFQVHAQEHGFRHALLHAFHQLFLIDLSALLKQLSNLLGVEVVGVLKIPFVVVIVSKAGGFIFGVVQVKAHCRVLLGVILAIRVLVFFLFEYFTNGTQKSLVMAIRVVH
mmetsp:Transcript_8859/g.19677  ORF Transcript_8859/g.19677 Transcript_8859/m.19677 type:complete len:254 (-) Transcript_8859:136-897(-)